MKTIKPLPSQEELHSLFEYKEGNLYWKTRPSKKIKINDKAGSLTRSGYIQLQIYSSVYRIHRIIWCYHFGPIANKLQIDHIDGNKTNNIIENLRLATTSQNNSNKKRAQRNSKSNILGVDWCKTSSKWRAQIGQNNKKIHIGWFASQEDARAARKTAELQYFGVFAP